MRTLGIIITSVAAVGAVAGLFLGIRSIPDVRRYLRMRSM